MRKTFLTFCVAALSLLAVSSCGKLEDSINKLDQGLKDLAARVDKLEKDLNDKIKKMVEEHPDKSLIEILSIIALNRSIVVASLKKQSEALVHTEELLLKELDGYLDNIDKNSR